ncbi:GntR family transcriptional regulator [Streptomyces sp. ITFR-6]|uniref:GntR family transcriptional regulator n=1 Tax=Streptomyces sp. ITFR-6 TaxID=3075197 RepID=UPI00288AD7B6|nr:GntR family transcriptional regulator [Streptomyces sp. ITFR-6]WNI31373.1 GntR family transcriptional regulator [Streptomyces sp. ITFR-6]
MAAIDRSPIYVQLADQLAARITSGEYEPGRMLPSEARLIAEFEVSRPTVRAAIGHLRAMGLVESQHGRGTFVRKHDADPAATINRSVIRRGKGFSDESLTPSEAAAVSRVQLSGAAGALLARADEEAICVDRLMTDPRTSTPVAHRLFIPMDTVAKAPELAEAPDAPVSSIYAVLVEAGFVLSWAETVSARGPLPDERATLGGGDGDPVLITRRVTADAEGGPLILEELRVSAAHGQFAFRVTPEKAPAARRKAGSV